MSLMGLMGVLPINPIMPITPINAQDTNNLFLYVDGATFFIDNESTSATASAATPFRASCCNPRWNGSCTTR